MSLIAIDFETRLISAEEPIPTPICISYYFKDKDGEQKRIVTGRDGMEAFLSKILSSDLKIIAHNMTFEALVIYEHFPKLKPLLFRSIESNRLICTKVYEQLIENTRKRQIHSVALDKLVAHYFNIDISGDKKDPNSWRLRYSELEDVELNDWPEEAKRYAIEDSKWAYDVYKEQLKTPMDIILSVKADIYLNLMGKYGILVDTDRVLTLEKELNDKLKPNYKLLESFDLVRFDAKALKYKKKMKNLRELISSKIKNVEKTAKGEVSTSSESITKYIAEDSDIKEALQTFLDIMKYEKILTAFVSRLKETIKSPEPIIRTNYKACVSSGRTASSTSPQFASVNIQQMPRSVEGVTWDIRNCFIPRPGYKICSIDYAGLELASTASQLYNLTGMRNMLDIVNSGDKPVDMHSMLAYRIMNIKEKTKETYESFVAKKKEKKYAAYRQLAKPINLGFPGGIGYDTMRTLLAREGIYPKLVVLESSPYETSLTWKRGAARKEGYPVRIRRVAFDKYELIYDELVLLKQELFNLYPDLEYFLSEGHKEYLTGESKMIKNEFGEWEKEPMYRFEVNGFKRDYCMYTQVCNGLLMQSPAAIGAKMAMNKIISKYSESKLANPLAFIHDEIVFEVLDNDNMCAIIKDISYILIEEMQNVLTNSRITVEAEVFDYWKKAGGFYEATYFKDPL